MLSANIDHHQNTILKCIFMCVTKELIRKFLSHRVISFIEHRYVKNSSNEAKCIH